jgi:hypothetical protein
VGNVSGEYIGFTLEGAEGEMKGVLYILFFVKMDFAMK